METENVVVDDDGNVVTNFNGKPMTPDELARIRQCAETGEKYYIPGWDGHFAEPLKSKNGKTIWACSW